MAGPGPIGDTSFLVDLSELGCVEVMELDDDRSCCRADRRPSLPLSVCRNRCGLVSANVRAYGREKTAALTKLWMVQTLLWDPHAPDV